MKSFNFHSVKNVKEATKLASGRTSYLAGGMTTLPAVKLGLASYTDIIDIKKIKELTGIKSSAKSLRIGATTKHVEVAESKQVKKTISSLSDLADGIGDPQVRNRGTIGGSLAHADPAAELPALAVALEAEFVLQGQSETRIVPASDFFISVLTTALQPGELLAQVRIPLSNTFSGYSFLEIARRHGDFALVGVACLLKPDTGRPELIDSARLVLMGVGDVPFRAGGAEAILSGQKASQQTFKEAAAAVLDEIEPASDLQASATYRRHLSGVLVYQATSLYL